MTYSKKIKEMRIEAIFGATEFSKELGVSREALFRWEKGLTKPSMSMVRKLVEFSKKHKLKYTAKDFLKGERNDSEK